VKELERRLALGTAVAGEIVATTGTCTTGTCTTATRGAAAANTPFVIGIATLGGSTIASAITAIFPTTGTRGAITATAAAVAATTTAAVAATTTAAVATTTTAAVATTTTAAATTRSTTPGFSFVDPKRTAHQFCTLKTFNRCVFGGLIRHLDERKTTLAACIPLEGQRTVRNFTELGKQFNHIFLLSAEGKVADKNAHVLRGPGTKQWTEEAWIIAIGP
jgi:hypothetical protein